MHAVVIKEDGEILGVGEINLKEELPTLLYIRDLYDTQIIIGKLNVSGFNPTLQKEIFKIKKETAVREEKYKAFVVYAKKWWNEFLQIRQSHSKRLVKIFVNSERGKTVVCNYVFPIRGKDCF